MKTAADQWLEIATENLLEAGTILLKAPIYSLFQASEVQIKEK